MSLSSLIRASFGLSPLKSRGFRCLSSTSFSAGDFEKASEETLESLCEKFEEILEESGNFQDSDVTLASGVLSVDLGQKSGIGIYVINKQSPNKQIWLSSPISGPARFDLHQNCWIYKHTNQSLHHLLNQEFISFMPKESIQKIDFTKCYLGGGSQS